MAQGTEHIQRGRYWNSNGHGVAVVAVSTEGIDWAAYIGADNGISEHDCILSTARDGDKLSEHDARHFFPDIKLPYRD